MDFQTYFELNQLYARYARALDAADWEAWPEFFIDHCVYKLQPRENHERGFPLATLAFDSKGMLKDRVYGIRETLFHDPYYQRHVVSAPVVLAASENRFEAQANYAVFRTKPGSVSEVYNVGRYIDELVRVDGQLRLQSRRCVYDSEMVLNSLIYPV